MSEHYIAAIAHCKFDEPIIIGYEKPTVLIIENPNEFYLLVREFIDMGNGGDGNFIITTEKGEGLSPEKDCEMISDIFSLDISDKKSIVTLHKELIKAAQDGELIMMQNEINTYIAEFFADLFDRFSLNLSFEEINLQDLLKITDVKIQDCYDSLTEKIICYINAISQLKHKSVFVFVNLKNAVSDDCLEQIYKHCRLEQLGLLLIEGRTDRERLKDEQVVTITDDLCQIS